MAPPKVSRYASADSTKPLGRMDERGNEQLSRELAGIWKNVDPDDRTRYEEGGEPIIVKERRAGMTAHIMGGIAVIAVDDDAMPLEEIQVLYTAEVMFRKVAESVPAVIRVKAIVFGSNVRVDQWIRSELQRRGIILVTWRGDREFDGLSANQAANLYVRRAFAHGNAVVKNFERMAASSQTPAASLAHNT